MNPDEMTLSSPNYPKWYNADGLGCKWLLTAPEGFIIALEFNHFHVSNLQYFVKMITTIFNIYFSCISYMIILTFTLYHSMMELVIKPKN